MVNKFIAIIDKIIKAEESYEKTHTKTSKGGSGSGNFNHFGRIGKIGGSTSSRDRILVENPPIIKKQTMRLLEAIKEAGGTPYIVGGFVRDIVMGKEPKDLDIEVYGLSPEKLREVLSQHGEVNDVGVSFGILKMDMRKEGGDELDISMPRTENKAGEGHRGFDVKVDQNLTPLEAARRRDFTMNSMFYDPLSEQVYDPFNGRQDIKDKILRHTSEAFAEDPLRVLRGMQFASRHNMDIAPETAELAKTLLPEYESLAKERLYGEWMKFAEKGEYPSKGLDVLEKTGWIDKYPALRDLINTHQELEYHPEDTAWEHTKQVADAAVEIAKRDNLSTEDKGVLVLASVLHDVGKPSTTDSSTGKITSHGHEQAGVPIAEDFLNSIGIPKEAIAKILPLIGNHLSHLNTINKKSVMRLAKRLEPSSIEMLARVIEADHSGRGSMPKGLPEAAKRMLKIAKELKVQKKPAEPILMGRHLINLGYKPGVEMGNILRRAQEAQLNMEFTDLDSALDWVQRNKDFETEEELKERIGKIISIKGGKGSGFFSSAGHMGRIGEVGGSSYKRARAMKIAKYFENNFHKFEMGEDVGSSSQNISYWMDREGNCYDVKFHGIAARNALKEVVKVDYPGEYGAIDRLLACGLVRFGISPNELYIESKSFTKKQMNFIRKLRRVYPEKNITFYTKKGRFDSWENFLYAFDEYEYNKMVEKSMDGIKTKGGEGSGNFGHSGRPGEVGGSGRGKISFGIDLASKVISLNKTDVERVREWQKNLPEGVDKLIDEIVIADGKDFEAEYVHALKEIGSTSSLVDVNDVYGFHYKDTKEKRIIVLRSTDNEFRFAHEVGHAVLNNSKKKNKWYLAYRDENFDRMTWYSKENVKEGFSETFGAYIACGGKVGEHMVNYEKLTESFNVVEQVISGI